MTNPQALREAIDIVLRCNDDAPGYGMRDQKDNSGQWYQSAGLANALLVVRQFLTSTTVATAVTQADARGIIEACAKVADGEVMSGNDQWCAGYDAAARKVARRIRAMKGTSHDL